LNTQTSQRTVTSKLPAKNTGHDSEPTRAKT